MPTLRRTLRPRRPLPGGLLAVLLLALLGLASPALAGPAEDAAARTTELVQGLMAVKKGPDGKLLASEAAAHKTLFARLDGFIDREALVGTPLKPHEARLSAAQLERARGLFWGILRTVTYTDTGRFFAQAKWSLKPGVVDGSRVAVPVDTFLPEEDERTEITFHWETAGGTPRLTDLSFDGASLVKDYQNQFGKLLEKDGPEGLLKKLEERLAREAGNRGPVE